MYKFFKILILTVSYLLLYYPIGLSSDEKIKIGLLVPLTGDNKEIGEQIVKSTRIALKDIKSKKLEIYPKDTGSNPNKTIQSAIGTKL